MNPFAALLDRRHFAFLSYDIARDVLAANALNYEMDRVRGDWGNAASVVARGRPPAITVQSVDEKRICGPEDLFGTLKLRCGRWDGTPEGAAFLGRLRPKFSHVNLQANFSAPVNEFLCRQLRSTHLRELHVENCADDPGAEIESGIAAFCTADQFERLRMNARLAAQVVIDVYRNWKTRPLIWNLRARFVYCRLRNADAKMVVEQLELTKSKSHVFFKREFNENVAEQSLEVHVMKWAGNWEFFMFMERRNDFKHLENVEKATLYHLWDEFTEESAVEVDVEVMDREEFDERMKVCIAEDQEFEEESEEEEEEIDDEDDDQEMDDDDAEDEDAESEHEGEEMETDSDDSEDEQRGLADIELD